MKNYYSIIKQKLHQQQYPIRFILSRLLLYSGVSSLFTIKRYGYRLRFYPSALSATLWVERNTRIADENFFIDYLQKGDNVIDVGANVGHLSIVAAKQVTEQGTVYAIEPHPRIYSYLIGNIKFNGLNNILSHNTALGESEGRITFSNKYSDDQNTIVKEKNGISLPIARLDKIINNELKIDLLKIDVEGYELFVLRGAKNLLKKTHCIYFESWAKHFEKYQYTCENLLCYLEEQDFQLFKFTSPNNLQKITNKHISRICENLLAIKNIDNFIQRTKYKITY